MNSKKYVLALDQGTTSSRAILFDKQQNIMEMAQSEFRQIYPRTGYVEHDPMEIYASVYRVMMDVLAKSGVAFTEIAAIGITNQRETTIIWDKHTGRPIYNAIVWQCRRTSEICETLKKEGWEEYIKENTGLLIDAYFSATKIKWILDNIPNARERAEKGDLLFGTVDTWLVWKMTNGKIHVTDRTNASRTMLFNIHTLDWDKKILDKLGIPLSILPEVRSSSEIYGNLNISGTDIPIAGIAGDQQAALFGQTCFKKGNTKNTYGTGCFLLMNTGSHIYQSQNGLITTLAATAGDQVQYAVEGSIFTAGAVVQWLRDEMGLLSESKESEYFAGKVPDNGGVYLVPAFTGLGAPHWDMYARGAILGMTRGTNRNHIIRAALESIAYQTKEILDAIVADTGIDIEELKVDGGASANNFLMQFQADILNKNIRRPMLRETTALGAAYLAGLAVGFWSDLEDILSNWTLDRVYEPNMEDSVRQAYVNGWKKAVTKAKLWETPN